MHPLFPSEKKEDVDIDRGRVIENKESARKKEIMLDHTMMQSFLEK
jgi:hypothetical protein